VIGYPLAGSPIMLQNQPRTRTTNQVSIDTLVPLSQCYALKKKLTVGVHYREIRSPLNNTKQIEWLPAGVLAIESLHWQNIGSRLAWSKERIESYKQTALWLEAALYLDMEVVA